MTKTDKLVLIGIIVLAFWLRLYRINRPLGDWHSWRQADTAAVTRRYVREGINLLVPKYDDLSNIPSGKDNPEGYRMVEFPFINAGIAWAYIHLPVKSMPVHVFSRYVSVLFSLGSLLFFFLLLRKNFDRGTTYLASLVFAVLPYNIFYSTVILPEVPLIFFIILSFFAFDRYLTNNRWYYLLLFTLAGMGALLIKPYFLFFGLGFVYLYLKRRNFRLALPIFVSGLVMLIPFVLWRLWIVKFPAGIPSYDWLLNSTNIRFKGAFFRWLFADRLGRLILGYWGLIPFAIGIIAKPFKSLGWFFHWCLLGLLIYLSVFATGNVTHDYYQIIMVPVIAFFVGRGLAALLNAKELATNPWLSKALAVVSLIFLFAFSWYHLRDYFNINNPAMVQAGLYADSHLPSDAKVIAPYGGDTAFLYQSNRPGWPIGGEIANKIKMGATAYLSTSLDDEAKSLAASCQVMHQEDAFILIDLTKCSLVPTN